MKKINLLVVATILIGSLSGSCKKGEDDPFFSLHSRTTRIVGEWELTQYTSKSIAIYTDATLEEIEVYDGTIYTYTGISTTPQNGTIISTAQYVQKIEYVFKKDGTYKAITNGGTWENRIVEEGIWSFVGKGEADGLKNKEAIMLVPEKSSSTSIVGDKTSSTYTGIQGNVIMLKQLKHKEMVWDIHYTSTSPDKDVSFEKNCVLTRKHP